jgi:hypothetical protein
LFYLATARIAPIGRLKHVVPSLPILAGSITIHGMPPAPRRYILHENRIVPGGRVAPEMKRMALLARVTVWTALLAAALSGRDALADAPPGCTDRLFAPPPMAPHFMMPNAGAWADYRGAGIEHDWTEARRRLAGPRPPSFRPLRSLLTWLESLLMSRSHHSAACVHCQAQPIDFELGYDHLPIDQDYFREVPAAPVPNPLDQPTAPDPSPLFNPLPAELPPMPLTVDSPPVVADPGVQPAPGELPPMNVVPTPAAISPEPKPANSPVVELAPEVNLPMDPPPARPIPKGGPRPPQNIVPLKNQPGR